MVVEILELILVALIAGGVGFFMHELLNILNGIKHALENPQTPQDKKRVAQVTFAEPKTAVEILADQEAERIKELNQ